MGVELATNFCSSVRNDTFIHGPELAGNTNKNMLAPQFADVLQNRVRSKKSLTRDRFLYYRTHYFLNICLSLCKLRPVEALNGCR